MLPCLPTPSPEKTVPSNTDDPSHSTSAPFVTSSSENAATPSSVLRSPSSPEPEGQGPRKAPLLINNPKNLSTRKRAHPADFTPLLPPVKHRQIRESEDATDGVVVRETRRASAVEACSFPVSEADNPTQTEHSLAGPPQEHRKARAVSTGAGAGGISIGEKGAAKTATAEEREKAFAEVSDYFHPLAPFSAAASKWSGPPPPPRSPVRNHQAPCRGLPLPARVPLLAAYTALPTAITTRAQYSASVARLTDAIQRREMRDNPCVPLLAPKSQRRFIANALRLLP